MARSAGRAAEAQSSEISSGSQTVTFHVRLDNFDGPFDLLLQLISRHKMDVTEVALSKVTDEFIAHVKQGGAADLDQTSSFLVVAATLLDLKAARLLPSGEVDDPEDLAMLEARDLLFARLLQYRAFKQISAWFDHRIELEDRIWVRPGGLEERFRLLAPEVTIPGGVERLARLAAKAFAPPESLELSLEHLHAPPVSVAEQALLVAARLRSHGTLSFRSLSADCDRITTVARFLALLELFREAAVSFEQLSPLGELTIRWTGGDDLALNISDEFDTPTNEPAQESGGEP